MAGFALRPQPPGRRTLMPAALRYALAVSRRTPVACSIRRKDQPSRPKASICCRLSSLNTLLMAPEATLPRGDVNVPGDYFSLAGFEVIMHGRFWVLTEALREPTRRLISDVCFLPPAFCLNQSPHLR